MARPLKEGLDYFPLNVDFEEDDKVGLIEAAVGIEGFAILIKLLCRIYKEGYYYPWTEREQLLFPKKVNVDSNLVTATINESLRWGFFSETLFEKHQILTSKGIQKRYIEAARRRKEITIVSDYLLVDPNFYLEEYRIEIALVSKTLEKLM